MLHACDYPTPSTLFPIVHWVWYLGSNAIRSPVLSLASRLWSCYCSAHCLTQASRSRIEAWCNNSPGFSQKKQCSGSTEAWTEVQVYFPAGSAFRFIACCSLVLLYCSQQLSCHLALWHCKISWLSWPSFNQGNIFDGKQSIFLKANKFSARVLYPAPLILRFEPAGHLSYSPVSCWQTTHFSQTVYPPSSTADWLGSWPTILYTLDLSMQAILPRRTIIL